jgi:hypothetical protein
MSPQDASGCLEEVQFNLPQPTGGEARLLTILAGGLDLSVVPLLVVAEVVLQPQQIGGHVGRKVERCQQP